MNTGWRGGQGEGGVRPVALMVLFAFVWAFGEIVLGSALQRHYDLMQIVWMRYGVHLLFMLCVWGWRRPARLWRTSRPAYQVGRSLLMLVMPASFALSLHAGATQAQVWALFWVAPLMVLGLAHGLLAERSPGRTWALVAVSTVGVGLVLWPRVPASAAAVAWPLAMAFSFALYVVMTRSLRTEPMLTNLFYTALGVFVVLTPYVAGVWVTPDAFDLGIMVGIGLVGFVGLAALDRAAECAPVGGATAMLHLHMLFVTLILWALAGDVPGRRVLLGHVLTCVALATLWWGVRRAASPLAREAAR